MIKIITSVFVTLMLSASIASAQTATVNISAFANGKFGNSSSTSTKSLPLVRAMYVTGPGTFVITAPAAANWCVAACMEGARREILICGGPDCITPSNANGTWSAALPLKSSMPLQQVIGQAEGKVSNWGALVGAFVPRSDVIIPGFTAVDQTKLSTGVGISPSELFFVGGRKTVRVNGAGTLYLGINDNFADDNNGSLAVTVKFTPTMVLYSAGQ